MEVKLATSLTTAKRTSNCFDLRVRGLTREQLDALTAILGRTLRESHFMLCLLINQQGTHWDPSDGKIRYICRSIAGISAFIQL